MNTFLDLMIVVVLGLVALSLLSLCLMFLTRKPKLKKVCFFIVVALGIYACTIGLRIFRFGFPLQTILCLAMGALSIIALVLELRSKDNAKKSKIARILATVALVVGMINAFL